MNDTKSFEFDAVIGSLDSDIWNLNIALPNEVVERYLQTDKRLVVTINDEIKIHRGMLSNGDGSYFVNINKEISKKLKLTVGDKLTVSITKDASKYGMPMPEEMDEILSFDDEASK